VSINRPLSQPDHTFIVAFRRREMRKLWIAFILLALLLSACGQAAAPTPTSAPAPTEAAEPTQAPEPTEAAEPTQAPEPTEAAEPTQAPEPTEAAETEPTEAA